MSTNLQKLRFIDKGGGYYLRRWLAAASCARESATKIPFALHAVFFTQGDDLQGGN